MTMDGVYSGKGRACLLSRKNGVLIYTVFLLFLCWGASQARAETIHVFVALCDNLNQGIVPVPAALGNGQDPDSNLYWGAMYGVRAYLARQPEWKLVRKERAPAEAVLERVIFKHASKDLYLVADAYDGSRMRRCLEDFLTACGGGNPLALPLGGVSLRAGGDAKLIVFVGHNGLMDMALESFPKGLGNSPPRDAAVLACVSRQYFTPALREAGARPVLLTTGLMAPEGYVLNALVSAWGNGRSGADVREVAAQAYNRYQKCGIKGARRLFSE